MRVAFLNEKLAIAQLVERAERLIESDKNVIAVGLFGSLATGNALPSSDADLLIVLREHHVQRWFDRIVEFEAFFLGTTLPVEIFPYTLQELDRMAENPGFIRTMLKDILTLAGDISILENLKHRS